VDAAERRLRLTHPGVRLAQQMQRLDDLSQRLGAAVRGRAHEDGVRLADLQARLAHCSPRHSVQEYGARAARLQARLAHAGSAGIARLAHRLALAQRGLHAVSPLATLSRGFAIVTGESGILTDAAGVAPGSDIEARLSRGTLTARVTGHKA
jgi:exodeoxyribonuclease VII large subunit